MFPSFRLNFASDFFVLLLAPPSGEKIVLNILSKDDTIRLGWDNHQTCDHGRLINDAPNYSAALPILTSTTVCSDRNRERVVVFKEIKHVRDLADQSQKV